MNIIIPIPRLTKTGGIERYTVEIIREFLRLKEVDKIVVVCSVIDENTVPKNIIENIEIIKTKSRPRTISFLFESRSIVRKLKKELGKDTIVYTQHGFSIGGDVVVAQAVHLSSILRLNRSFFSKAIRFFYPPHIKASLVESYNFSNAKKVIAISNLIKENLHNDWKIPNNNIKVIYSAANVDEFKRNGVVRNKIRAKLGIKDKFVVSFAGNEFKRKNLTVIIEALSLLDNKVHLLVAGKDNPRKYIDLAKSLNVDKNITFLGLTRNLQDYFSASDAFVFPTLYEAFGLVTLEAMASGLPVITTDTKVNGAAELIKNNENGMLIKDPFNPDEIANKITLLIKDKKLRNKISINARKTAEVYDYKKTAKETLRVFKEVLGEKR